MQIDTRNREHGVSAESVHNCTNMDECAGYEPRQARYGRNWGGRLAKPKVVDGYSGILECPCNSRYGGDPEFVRRQYGSYQCDETGCDEMKCKCKKYCRCRGVPIAMFEGEDDSNSRGPPKADGGAPGFEPWHPDIATEYTFNTEPPREGD